MRETIEEQNQHIGRLMEDFVRRTVEFSNTLPDRPIRQPDPQEVMDYLQGEAIPAQGRPLEEVYGEMLEDVYRDILFPQHPRSFACIPSTASLLSWMGDVMTNAFNPHASCQVNAPAANLIEKKLIGWMCGLAGYPQGSGGLFVSGGSIANLTALTAARDAKLAGADRSRARVYVSDQTHSSVAKGLHILGFNREQLRTIPTDRLFRMDVSCLRTAVEEDRQNGLFPFAVVASAGTTNTGSVDPLKAIAGLCRQYHMWMHVDGAFGASALVSPRQRKELAGIELSDSLSWDAHKWLLQTYGCSVALVRDKSTLVNSFAAHPEYLKDAQASQDSVEFWDLGPELTRPARGLKLWLTLQVMGTQALGQAIDHGCLLALAAQERLEGNPEWQVVSPAHFGIVNFRFAPSKEAPDATWDQINQEMAREVTATGFAQVYTTQLRGRTVLRLCAINPRTTPEDVLQTIQRLESTQAAERGRRLAEEKGLQVG